MSHILFKHEDWNRADDLDATIYVYQGWFGLRWVRTICWPRFGSKQWCPKSYRRLLRPGLSVHQAAQIGYALAEKWRAGQ